MKKIPKATFFHIRRVTTMKQIFCVYCGAPNDENEEKCIACGAELKKIAPAKAEETPAEEPTVAEEAATAEEVAPVEETAEAEVSPAEETEAVEESSKVEKILTVEEPEEVQVETPVAPEVPVIKVKKSKPAKAEKKKSGSRVGAIIGTIFLSILLFVFLTVTVLLFSLQRFTSKDNIADGLSKVDMYDAIDIATGNDDLVELVKKYLPKSSLDRIDLNEKSLKKIINSREIERFVSKKAEEYIDDIKNGDDHAEITNEEVFDLITSLEDKIRDELDYSLTYDDYNVIEKNIANAKLELYSLENIKENNETVFLLVKLILSEYLLYGFAAIDLLLVAFIILVNKKRVLSGIKATAILLVVNGAILSVTYAAYHILISFLPSNIKSIIKLASSITNSFINTLLLSGLAFLGAGIVILLIVSAIKKIIAKIKEKKNAKIAKA